MNWKIFLSVQNTVPQGNQVQSMDVTAERCQMRSQVSYKISSAAVPSAWEILDATGHVSFENQSLAWKPVLYSFKLFCGDRASVSIINLPRGIWTSTQRAFFQFPSRWVWEPTRHYGREMPSKPWAFIWGHLWLSPAQLRHQRLVRTFALLIIGCACLFTQSFSTPCSPMGCSLLGSSVHGIFQVRMLECIVSYPFRGSSQPRDWTWVSCISSIGSGFLLASTTQETLIHK